MLGVSYQYSPGFYLLGLPTNSVLHHGGRNQARVTMDEGNPSSDPAWSGTRGGSGPLSASSAEVPDGWRPLDDAASDADQVGAADRKPRQGISPFRAAGVLVLPLPPAGPAHGDVSSGPRYSPANKGGMTISTLPAARLRLQPHLPRVLRQVRHVRGRLGLRHDVRGSGRPGGAARSSPPGRRRAPAR